MGRDGLSGKLVDCPCLLTTCLFFFFLYYFFFLRTLQMRLNATAFSTFLTMSLISRRKAGSKLLDTK